MPSLSLLVPCSQLVLKKKTAFVLFLLNHYNVDAAFLITIMHCKAMMTREMYLLSMYPFPS